MRILVSACLLGVNCRYDGGGNRVPSWLEALKPHQVIPVCPEQLGGLTTPRPPAEIVSEEPLRVLTDTGGDVTAAFLKGAEETLMLAELLNADCAVLKERSPSCGVNHIYDGTFSRVKLSGQGLAARALKRAGVSLYSEEELDRFLQEQGSVR